MQPECRDHLVVGVAIVAAAGIRWLSAGSIETAPILFVAVVAAAWWLDRPAGVAVAVASVVTGELAAASCACGAAVTAVACGAVVSIPNAGGSLPTLEITGVDGAAGFDVFASLGVV